MSSRRAAPPVRSSGRTHSASRVSIVLGRLSQHPRTSSPPNSVDDASLPSSAPRLSKNDFASEAIDVSNTCAAAQLGSAVSPS